jgi:ribosomal protein S18 acetylase RimI-like enzyme
MFIEQANVADAEEILTLQRLAYQSEAVLNNDFSILPLTQTLEQMRADFERQAVLKATIDGKIVGSARGYLREGTCHVGRLIVHPEFQRRGIGTSLLNALERHFSAADRYELFTGEHSERNLALYQKLGYRAFRTERLTGKTAVVFLEKPGPAAAPK